MASEFLVCDLSFEEGIGIHQVVRERLNILCKGNHRLKCLEVGNSLSVEIGGLVIGQSISGARGERRSWRGWREEAGKDLLEAGEGLDLPLTPACLALSADLWEEWRDRKSNSILVMAGRGVCCGLGSHSQTSVTSHL